MPDDKNPSSFFKRGSGAGEVRKVSSAPPPITPVRGSAPSWVGRPPAVRPSWDEWAMMDAVTVYEAAALSLDLEPRRHGQNDRYSFPDDQAFNRFEMRCRIIEEGDGHALGRSGNRVSLPAFAAWAVAKRMDIPAELRALAGASILEAKAATVKAPIDPTQEKLEILRKRAAFIQEFQGIWPTIDGDMRDASRNGLSLAANARHGFWRVGPALNWANERGRIKREKAKQFVCATSDSELSILVQAMLDRE